MSLHGKNLKIYLRENEFFFSNIFYVISLITNSDFQKKSLRYFRTVFIEPDIDIRPPCSMVFS